jgi:hypothetical protein
MKRALAELEKKVKELEEAISRKGKGTLPLQDSDR